MSLQDLKTAILADGVVDAGEVTQLKTAILADGVVDREEADVLFEINDKVSGKANAPEWGDFFVSAISDHVLKDEKTPGVVDQAEGDYILGKVIADGKIDDLERRLLANIKANAIQVPTNLTAKFTELGI